MVCLEKYKEYGMILAPPTKPYTGYITQNPQARDKKVTENFYKKFINLVGVSGKLYIPDPPNIPLTDLLPVGPFGGQDDPKDPGAWYYKVSNIATDVPVPSTNTWQYFFIRDSKDGDKLVLKVPNCRERPTGPIPDPYADHPEKSKDLLFSWISFPPQASLYPLPAGPLVMLENNRKG